LQQIRPYDLLGRPSPAGAPTPAAPAGELQTAAFFQELLAARLEAPAPQPATPSFQPWKVLEALATQQKTAAPAAPSYPRQSARLLPNDRRPGGSLIRRSWMAAAVRTLGQPQA
jgi:hypothetical protein